MDCCLPPLRRWWWWWAHMACSSAMSVVPVCSHEDWTAVAEPTGRHGR